MLFERFKAAGDPAEYIVQILAADPLAESRSMWYRENSKSSGWAAAPGTWSIINRAPQSITGHS